MDNSPQCMTYIPWKTNSMNEDTMLIGDDQGEKTQQITIDKIQQVRYEKEGLVKQIN